jgi:hypothetical protein
LRNITRHCSGSGYGPPQLASGCNDKDRAPPGTSSAGPNSSAIPAGCYADEQRSLPSSARCLVLPAVPPRQARGSRCASKS